MPTLDATVGGANSNSYGTLQEANDFFDTQQKVEAWTSLPTDDDKIKYLIMATERIDQEDYLGTREKDTQALKFPRINLPLVDGINYNSLIPIGIKKAQFLLALHLINNNMNQLGVKVGGAKKVKLASIEVENQVDASDNNSYSYNSLPPYVKDYLGDFSLTLGGGTISLMR